MTKPNDTPEPSPASASSHGEPVAWAVVLADGQRIYDVYGIEEEAKAIDEAVTGNHGIVPLYRSPTITGKERKAMDPVDFGGLTDEEREAIDAAQTLTGLEAAATHNENNEREKEFWNDCKSTLRMLLERTK